MINPWQRVVESVDGKRDLRACSLYVLCLTRTKRKNLKQDVDITKIIKNGLMSDEETANAGKYTAENITKTIKRQ